MPFIHIMALARRRALCLRLCLGVSLVSVVLPTYALAQEPPEEFGSEAPARLGPLRVAPRVTLLTGIDTNVFNTATEERRDTSIELRPELQSWLRIRRLRVTTNTAVQLQYFQQFASERSVNARQDARFEFVGNRVSAYVSGLALSSRERLNEEIDVRARRTETFA